MFGIQQFDAPLGAEITGLDLATPLEESTLANLYQTWLQHKVLVFRNQNLSPEQQVMFTGQFGEIDSYPFLQGIPEHPLVAPVLKLPEHKVNFGGVWHSDTAYLETPAKGATLYALEIPSQGGDTIFADMALVYRTLPVSIASRLEGLMAVNRSDRSAVSQTRNPDSTPDLQVEGHKVFRSEHPVIRQHPETGEKLLYVNAAHTEKILGIPPTESESLLRQLTETIERPEFHFRLQWQPGTLILWDNRITQHFPMNDYPGHRRLLHRVSLKGDNPV